jgi:hypothetical protein
MDMIKLINKRWKEHKEERDPDDFACCPVRQQFETRVAPEGEWLGTEESRQQALKDQEFMDKNISCDFCSLCSELISILKSPTSHNRNLKTTKAKPSPSKPTSSASLNSSILNEIVENEKKE